MPCVWVGSFTDCAKLKIVSRSRILDMLISRAIKIKFEITKDQQTICKRTAVFQKCRQLFNKQEIGKFIFAIRWRSVETEKVDRPFFQQQCCLKQFKKIMFKTE